MYIIKISENSAKGYYNGLPNMLDGYHEVDTLEKALEMREWWINEYPFLVKVEIFKSNKIEIKDDIQEIARKRKKEYWFKVAYYKSLGFNGYTELNEKGEVIFEF